MFVANVKIITSADAYTAGDVVGGPIMLAASVPQGTTMRITTSKLLFPITAIPAGMTSYDLHFYREKPPSALADNAAFDVPSGDQPYYAGKINLGSPADLGSSLWVQQQDLNFDLQTGYSLWAYLVTVAGNTLSTAPVVSLSLFGLQGI